MSRLSHAYVDYPRGDNIRPETLHQPVLAIPGVKGPWNVIGTSRGDIHKSVTFGMKWIKEQSGHTSARLIIPWAIAEPLAAAEEMMAALGDPYQNQIHINGGRCLPKFFAGSSLYITTTEGQFHASAVPMLVAPSVERPLWKVVFTDAIGEKTKEG